MNKISGIITQTMLVCTFANIALGAHAQGHPIPTIKWPGGDPAIDPGTDFFLFANGSWLKENPIPPDLGGYSNATMLKLNVAAKVKDLLEEAAANVGDTPVTERDKVGAYYASFMDTARIESLGAAQSRSDLARLMGHANDSFQDSLFSLTIEADSRHAERNAIYLGQGGLGKLDRDLYLSPDAAQLRADYLHYLQQVLALIHWEDPDRMAAAVMAYESGIARCSWTAAEQRDVAKTYHPMRVEQLVRQAPEFPWQAYLDAAQLGREHHLIVVESSAVNQIATLFRNTPLDVLKAWAAFHVVDNAALLLSQDFADAWFALHGRQLANLQVAPPRWQRAMTQVAGGGSKDRDVSPGAMGDAVGRLYVERWFDTRSRDTLRDLVNDLKSTLRTRIALSDWMSPQAKAEAANKLDAYQFQIGMPEHMDDFSDVQILRDDLFGNAQRTMASSWHQDLIRLHQPPDRLRWTMTPQTVNAYNYAPYSVVVFTAALLQPPAFDPTQDRALTYGGIGAIIGHELTHAFDDVGRKFDATGRVRDWWTADDNQRFAMKAEQLVALFSQCEAAPGLPVNGKLTLGENIADIGGLQLAYAAYHASLHGQPAPVIDGLTGDQRFFLGFAKLRRGHRRPQLLQSDVSSDPHTPDRCRVNEDVRNLDGWYDAFGVTPGSPLFLEPERRSLIW